MFNNSKVDDLTYNYLDGTNQINNISDAGIDNVTVHDYRHIGNYTYDQIGNMLQDGGRGNNLEYFSTLNLPMQIDFGNGAHIDYDYTATGSKLVKHAQSTTDGIDLFTHYIGNIIYENGKLSYIITPEGRMVASGEGSGRVFVYEYDLKDHLGNTRVTFRPGETSGTKVMQTNSYYPFGLTMYQNPAEDENYTENKYLYNGKELQNKTLNSKFFGMYDYGARMYDPQLGRFSTIDPYAEVFCSLTPYHYCANNPIKYIDINGEYFTGAYQKWLNKIDDFFKNQIAAKQAQITNNEIKRIKAENAGNIKKAERLENRIQRQEGQLVAIKDNRDQVQGEIATLAGSTQEYHIVEESGLKSTVTVPGGSETNENGITSFNFSTGAVEIAIDPDASIGIFAHELKHGYQFETGTMSLGARGKTYFTSFLYDQSDENVAYQRQGMFGSTKTYKYDYLPPGPIDINTVSWYGIPISNLKPHEYQNMLKRLNGNIAFRKDGKTYQ